VVKTGPPVLQVYSPTLREKIGEAEHRKKRTLACKSKSSDNASKKVLNPAFARFWTQKQESQNIWKIFVVKALLWNHPNFRLKKTPCVWVGFHKKRGVFGVLLHERARGALPAPKKVRKSHFWDLYQKWFWDFGRQNQNDEVPKQARECITKTDWINHTKSLSQAGLILNTQRV